MFIYHYHKLVRMHYKMGTRAICRRDYVGDMCSTLHASRIKKWPEAWKPLIDRSQAYNRESIYPFIDPTWVLTGPSSRIYQLLPSSKPKWRTYMTVDEKHHVIELHGGADTYKYKGNARKSYLLASAGLFASRDELEMDSNLLYPKDYFEKALNGQLRVCTVQAAETFFIVHRTPLPHRFKCTDYDVGHRLCYNGMIWTYPGVLDDGDIEAEEFGDFVPEKQVDIIIMIPAGTWYRVGKDHEVILPAAKLEIVEIDSDESIVFASLYETAEMQDFQTAFSALDSLEQERFVVVGKEWVLDFKLTTSLKKSNEAINPRVEVGDCVLWDTNVRSVYMRLPSADTGPGDVLKLGEDFAMIRTADTTPPAGNFDGMHFCQVHVPAGATPTIRRRSWRGELDVEVFQKGTLVNIYIIDMHLRTVEWMLLSRQLGSDSEGGDVAERAFRKMRINF